MKKNKGYFLPISIVIAVVLIVGAVLWNSASNTKGKDDKKENTDEIDITSVEYPHELIASVSEDDHIRGVLGAPITIVEYTDFKCPFCDDFHITMKRLTEDYSGQITWIERQFPIDSLHPTAPKEAEASECAAKISGNNAFWAFSDKLFEVNSQEGATLEDLPQIAEEVGIDRAAFEECLNNGDTKYLVEKDLNEVTLLNSWIYYKTGRYIGTPYSVVIVRENESLGIPGALSYDDMKPIIDELLERN